MILAIDMIICLLDFSVLPSTEAALNILEWPERQIQQYNESQRRSLSRIQSTESMPMSSPLQSCDSKLIKIQLAKFA